MQPSPDGGRKTETCNDTEQRGTKYTVTPLWCRAGKVVAQYSIKNGAVIGIEQRIKRQRGYFFSSCLFSESLYDAVYAGVCVHLGNCM